MQNQKLLKNIHKLSFKLFISTIFPITIVLTIAAILCINTVFSSTNNLIKQQLKVESDSSCTQILALLDQYLSLLSRESNNNCLQNYLRALTSDKTPKTTAYYTDVEKILNNISLAKPDVILFSWIADFDSQYGFSNSDANWSVDSKKWDIQKQPWYKNTTANDLPYITDIYNAPIQNLPVVSIIVPILDENTGTCLGVLGVNIKLNYIKKFISKNQQLSEMQNIIIDGNNKILSHPNDEYLDTNISDYLYSDVKTINNTEKNQELFSYSIENQKFLAIITDLPGYSWKVITTVPKNYSHSQIAPLAHNILIILIGCILVLFLVMMTISKRIASPLEKITAAAKEIAKGNYSFRISSSAKDEIGELARAVDTSIHALRHRALFDDLTQIYNEYALTTQIQTLFKENPTSFFAIIRFDIARFKLINDMFGETKGDALLQYIANILIDQVSPESAFGRLNNDVFCICRKYTTKDELVDFIDKLSLHIEAFPINFNLIPYFGICISVPSTVPSISILFDWSKLALNTIKGSTLTNYAFYDSTMRNQLLTEGKIEREMVKALKTKQFQVYLQPKCNIKSSEVVGAEALVRWIHPMDGFINPASFIPLFEKNGFIVRLDEYVWEETCRILREWLDKSYRAIPISINISRVHMFDPEFIKKLLHLIKTYQIPTHLLELEFTESVFVEDISQLYSIMNQLRENGFILAMDDFGSGYSSLNMLKEGPVDVIKIDREFLNDTVTTDNGKIVIRNTISMINQLHKGIVAEGVETKEQANFLLSVGCNIAQGFYYSKPISQLEFEKFAFHINT
ncbi:bifunctional diguanylate cyclase/phosphodiesterase [Velocimicrobium porci]|uniref:EAL domain-containing protein n=1 Tax=Velocimicrobium porci TaxID=2606634 RepID=A0A6L5XV24_9FIRM|nr:EAL domain-containing protein [Velocimicrobium porci]MSS62562.1 EAL domain-containing protein [Velocimicrobium porci]